jgi:hypothetical protein
MIKKLILFLLLPLAAVAQTPLSGRILDSQTHQPVPYASVVVVGTIQGTTANAEGEFALTLPRLPAKVVASSLGYRRDSARITQPEQALTLRLIPALVELPTVQPTSYAAQLLMQAYHQVQRTRQQPEYGQAFYRQVTRNDGQPTEVMEAVWNVKVSPAGLEGSCLAQGRYGARPAFMNFANFALYAKVVGGFCGVSALDSTDSHAVVSANPEKYFALRYKGVTSNGTYQLAEVAYESRPGIPAAQGSVFIDLASHQVLHARATRVAELTPSTPRASFRSGVVTVEADFKPSPTGTVLNYINCRLSALVAQPRKPDVPVLAESLTYFYDLRPAPTGLPYTGPDAVANDLVAIKRKVYDPTYWRDNSMVKRTPLEDEIMHSFEVKKAFGTLLKPQ